MKYLTILFWKNHSYQGVNLEMKTLGSWGKAEVPKAPQPRQLELF